MEIIVEGKGMITVVPDQVIINFDFITKGETYEEVLELGSRNVYDFIQNIIVSNGFNSDDLKTRSFVKTKFATPPPQKAKAAAIK